MAVPSLVNEDGYFYPAGRLDEFMSKVRVEELKKEFSAQTDFVVSKGLSPAHLDSHCHVHTRRIEIFDMVVGLAHAYGLALRVHTTPFIAAMRERGLPGNDHNVMDSYDLPLKLKMKRYLGMLRSLPSGLSEWAVHPGLKESELMAMEARWRVRFTDWEFLMSAEARHILADEGIIRLDFRKLQEFWSDPVSLPFGVAENALHRSSKRTSPRHGR
jgi:predicted glycoside hydrolase/deacetylase ChbG (UPF0249 family)